MLAGLRCVKKRRNLVMCVVMNIKEREKVEEGESDQQS